MPPKPKQNEEPDEQRFNRVFSALPALGSAEYIEHIKQAPAGELPPQVLARAYRQLPHDSAAAKATIGRLLDFEDRHGYLASMQRAARRRISPHDWFDSDELILEGHVRLEYSKDGLKAMVEGDHIAVAVADGHLEVVKVKKCMDPSR